MSSIPRSSTLLRAALVANAVAAVLLGYVGISELLMARTGAPGRPLDIIYYDLQLFVLDAAPIQSGGPYPASLEFARFAAGVTTFAAAFEVIRLLLSRRLGEIRTKLVKKHVIICGEGPAADALAASQLELGRQVVRLLPETAEHDDVRDGAARVAYGWPVTGDLTEPSAFIKAGALRATHLYICVSDNAGNAAIAMAARRATAGRRRVPLQTYANVVDHELCAAIKARSIGLLSDPYFRLDFFNFEQIAARRLAEQEATALADVPLENVRFVIVGLGGFGEALLLETARVWRAAARTTQTPITVSVVNDPVSGGVSPLTDRQPILRDVCRIKETTLSLRNGNIEDVVSAAAGAGRDCRIYICDQAPDDGIRLGLQATRRLRAGRHSVTICLYRKTALADAFGADSMFDDMYGRLRVMSVLESACSGRNIEDDVLDRLARLIHENYVRAQLAKGADGRDNIALRAWAGLPPDLRSANRAQAAHIGVKLAKVGCTLVPAVDGTTSFVFSDEEIELLARLEHSRWMAERGSRGIGYGRSRTANRHPDMVSWEELPESAREKDRDVIRFLPTLVAEAGFQIVRVANADGLPRA